MNQLTLDFDASRAARDLGLITVEANTGSWHPSALMVIADLPPGWTGLGEDIRAAVVASDVGEPHSRFAWGALVNAALKQGLIALSGVRRPMRDPKSHARRSDEYYRTAKTLNTGEVA